LLPGAHGGAAVLAAPPGDPALLDLALESDAPAIAATDGGEAPGPASKIERVTVFGPVHVAELPYASDVIFVDPVVSDRRQAGCVRFSYVPAGSQTPRRYHCRPEGDASLQPRFTSRRFGDPGYCQLSRSCPPEISGGGSDDSEMGAFHAVRAAQREANLRTQLDDYLRFGLEAGIIPVT
jgi:hypothetical protein